VPAAVCPVENGELFATGVIREMSEYHVNVEPTPVAIKSGIAVPKQAV
jgi:hypothetical protein